ncbi:hypothetical protein AZE42_03826 [Rhizopogon vesiculosus]|uniref:Uncharacterized protein n=1 Tax=Rhizopogon vesiculosus TaxID=180088 RepID=A0A1J8QKP9_9AGAM|nr:hypothetical protein AZE42_03826 [Rhizopogon vesiculosus]
MSCDDVYSGLFIPKDVLLTASQITDRISKKRLTANLSRRAMGHNEEVYPNPSRVCPGRLFEDNALWASVVSIISTIEIAKAKAKDKDGKDVDVKPEIMGGIATRASD